MSATINPTHVEFPVSTRSTTGEPIAVSRISVAVQGPAGVAPVQARLIEKAGSVLASFDVTLTGDYKVSVTFDGGKHLQNSPVTINVKVKESANEQNHVPALDAPPTYPVAFETELLDADMKKFAFDLSHLTVTAEGPERVQPTLLDAGNGKLRCQFSTTRAEGDYVVRVNYKGKPIQRSPFDVSMSIGQSKAPSAHGAKGLVGEVVSLPEVPKTINIGFAVPGKKPDDSGLERRYLGLKLPAQECTAAMVSGPKQPSKIVVEDGEGDKLNISMDIDTAGDYKIMLKHKGVNVDDFDITVPAEAVEHLHQ